MFSKLKAELDAVMARDPAARSRAEVLFSVFRLQGGAVLLQGKLVFPP